MSRFHIATIGCRANTADSMELAARLRARGSEPAAGPELANLIVVNTCSVTAAADADARQLVRRFRQLSPEAHIVVTGCYAERAPLELEALDAVDRVVGNRLKLRLPEILDGELDGSDQTALWELPEAYPIFGEGGYTRAFVKVQDGCDARCSFCIIPTTRGPGRSVPLASVRERVAASAATGVKEVVLSGIHLGRYGRDLTPPTTLADLLLELLAAPRPERLRLTSVEPREVDERLSELLVSSPRLARHLHVPLQSGSDRILGLMRRPYTTAHYARTLETLALRAPGIALGADVMVGFPGESDADFASTATFIASSPLTYLHVFRYSPRPGTLAAELPDRVPPPLARARARRLRELSDSLNLTWRRSLVGREVDALTLTQDEVATEALTENYVRVVLPARLGLNRLVRARVVAASAVETRAELVGSEA